MSTINIIEVDTGDWVLLQIDGGNEIEGHNLSHWDFKTVLESLGHTVNKYEITQENYELGNYDKPKTTSGL